MGWFEGGLFMTMVYFTILIFFIGSGIAGQVNPILSEKIQCVPNEGNIGQYGGLDSNQMGANCGDLNSSDLSIYTTYAERPGIASFLGDFPNAIKKVILYFTIFASGWVTIMEVIFGAGPLAFLIWPIGGILQVFQLLFLVDLGNKLIAIFRGGQI